MTRRAGVTLMEVLVAVVITGVGLLALLTLFPLGAMEMAQSVKRDRCGHYKHNSASIANMFGYRSDPAVKNAMLNTAGTLPAFGAAYTGPSYPVYIDPLGSNYLAFGGAKQQWVGGLVGNAPPRVTPNSLPFGTGLPQLYPWCVAPDEIYFPRVPEDYLPQVLSVGSPCPPGGTVERTPRYSWAYVAQMPSIADPKLVDLTVVIYSGRPIRPFDDPTAGETWFPANFNPGNSTASLYWGGAGQPGSQPELTVGTWLMDGTVLGGNPRATFHRIVGIGTPTPTGTGGMYQDVEVLPPTRFSGAGNVFIMENVAEVYFRGDY